jgi:dTDP-4-dehydrorhamnose 3,5-epimerase
MDERKTTIEGVFLTPLKQIRTEKGSIYHAMKSSEETFQEFGEAYFSFVHHNDIKAWKIHQEMLLNLVVPIGSVKFVMVDQREGSPTFGHSFETTLNPEDNYKRLTIPPKVTFGFKGVGEETNLVLNMASIEHRPDEVVNLDLNEVTYNW